MTSSAVQRTPDAEHLFLAALQDRYLDQGFTFIIEPAREQLPDFMVSYKPDAIAKKPGSNIAIEVKRRADSATEPSLKEIRRLFEGHPDWQFVVAYVGSDPFGSLTIPASALESVTVQLEAVRALLASSQLRASFVMAWSLLEAVLRRVEGDSGARPRGPGTVVQTLAMLGYIDPDLERRIRPLIALRNRVVHGDLEAQPSADDVQLILSAIEQTLANEGH